MTKTAAHDPSRFDGLPRLLVKPTEGRRVRTENGRRHIRKDGEAVVPSTYYRRRLIAGDLVEVDSLAADTKPAAASSAELVTTLEAALAALEQDNPDHWTESGKPDLNHLTDVLNRRVTRKEVDQVMQEARTAEGRTGTSTKEMEA